MRIVVTGGSGRIGTVLVQELLSRDHEVTIFDQTMPRELPAGVSCKLGDCADQGSVYDVLRGHDAVIHLAAIPNNRYHPYPVVFRTNVVATYNVAEAAGRLGLRKIVAASSINAMGLSMAERPEPPRYLPMDEDHPRLPQDAYSLTKLVDEETLAAIHRRTGIPTIAIRPPALIGPTYQEGASIEARLADPGLMHRVFWVYCDIRDLAVGFRLAVETETVQRDTFFLTADDALCREPLCDVLPRYWPTCTEMAAGLTGTSPAVVSTRAKRLLGYQPVHTWREYVS
ncbi:MAG: NAD(P)-dependent oxidoreductase [Chloroflexota bacterium]